MMIIIIIIVVVVVVTITIVIIIIIIHASSFDCAGTVYSYIPLPQALVEK